MRLRRTFGQSTGRKPTSPRRRNWLDSPGRQQKYAIARLGWFALFYGKATVDRMLKASLDTNSAPVAE